MPKSNNKRGRRKPKNSGKLNNRTQTSSTNVLGGGFNRGVLGKLTVCHIPNSTMFPDVVMTQGRTNVIFNQNYSGGGNIYSWNTFKLNGFMNNFGPSFNGGSFASNVPSGSSNWMGSSGPYDTCWSLDSEIDIQCTCTGSSSTYTPIITIFPSLSTYSALNAVVATTTQQLEQRGAAQLMLQAISIPTRLSAHYAPWDVIGISKSMYMNSGQYANTISTDPNVVALVHIIAFIPSGYNVSLNITFKTRYKFAGTTLLSTLQPS